MEFRIIGFVLTSILIVSLVVAISVLIYIKMLRTGKNYERGLKLVSLHIHLPPSSTDIESERSGRDQRELTDEILSQAQVMYNIIASTIYKGMRSKIFGQRHLSFEIVAKDGLIYYYVMVPISIADVVKQSISTAYPSARLEEIEDKNIFSEETNENNIVGGEFSLKKESGYPILTYQDSKQDVSRSLLNSLSKTEKGDGVAIQILLRPANDNWIKSAISLAKNYKEEKTSKKTHLFFNFGDIMEALWKPPEVKSSDSSITESKQLNSLDQSIIEAIENKVRYSGFETLIRVVVASENQNRSKAVLQNITSSFALFNSPNLNSFKFNKVKPQQLITAYLMRFFPQEVNRNVLNSIELSTIFHLPSQKDIPTSQIKRQMTKQVDGPTDVMDEGLLLGYNEFRGNKKPIRLSVKDRRRHTYFIGQTGTGKSVLLENLAYQDIMDGKGFAFIDPHGDSAEKLMGMIPRERAQDVIYFNPGDLDNPIGLNLFEFETEDQKDFLIQESIQMLYGLYDPGHTGIVGPRFETWFRNAALALMADPAGSTFIDVPQMFSDQNFADYKLQFVKDQTVLDFWQKEMAIMPESAKGEILGWFSSKFGAFLSNEMMRNIIGQTKSGFNMREIMDNNKILLVNLSKGKTGELNSSLLGMIFVMKFQVAAMGRADMPENERKDFCLYVDEFQNFATESFESILSEARKYRLNLIVANQFMTQLSEKIREAVIGNVGTIISGRIGVTDAELLQKRFLPVFNAEDLARLPNYQAITTVMINNTPSDPFSMSLVPPMAQDNAEIQAIMKQLSATKYGKPRQEISQDIYGRLAVGDKMKEQKIKQQADSAAKLQMGAPQSSGGNDFLDKWLTKRKQLKNQSSQTPQTESPKTKTTVRHLSDDSANSVDHVNLSDRNNSAMSLKDNQKKYSSDQDGLKIGENNDESVLKIK